MNRTVANVAVDLAAAVLFVGIIATGYVLRFPLPPGTNRTLTVWGLTRHQWGTVHFWISAGLLAIVAAHLVLHWKWIVTVIGKRLGLVKTARPSMWRSGIAVALVLAAAFGLFAFVAHMSVREMAQPLHELDASGDGAAGQEADRETELPPVASAGLSDQMRWLFEQRCVSCHGPHRQLAGLRVDQPEDLLGARDDGPAWIVPGDSAGSPLMAIVAGEKTDIRMLDRHRLADSELRLIRKWIDGGAAWPDRRD